MMGIQANNLALSGKYYNECHALFRSQSNQQELMLATLLEEMEGRRDLRILSVGSGMGLFELPLLQALTNRESTIRHFVGIDINQAASQQFEKGLRETFGKQFDFEVRVDSFESFESQEAFDFIIFNHVFEYIEDQHEFWIEKAVTFLEKDGIVALFSPLRGGINQCYEHYSKDYFDRIPFFSDNITEILEKSRSAKFLQQNLMGTCKLHFLKDEAPMAKKMMLLSFLCQIDCRQVPEKEIEGLIDYFRGMENKMNIPHPTDFFRIWKA